jgi:hypothetical protein
VSAIKLGHTAAENPWSRVMAQAQRLDQQDLAPAGSARLAYRQQ